MLVDIIQVPLNLNHFIMDKLNNIPLIQIKPLRMHSVSSVQVPKNISNFNSLEPYVRLKPLNLNSATSFHVPSLSINKCFYNGPRIVISPLKSTFNSISAVHKRSLYKRHRVYPTIQKCFAKRCLCCSNISCNSTIKSTVNGRTFNVKITSDVDCNSTNIIYVLT